MPPEKKTEAAVAKRSKPEADLVTVEQSYTAAEIAELAAPTES
jgi:hypothetical protein